jgi:hypothetical protein
VRHDLTPHYGRLDCSVSPADVLTVTHYTPDLCLGDEILWGPNVFEATTWRVVAVTNVRDVADQWFARCVRVRPALYVCGAKISA